LLVSNGIGVGHKRWHQSTFSMAEIVMWIKPMYEPAEPLV
jgi:hypothetical protein